MSWDKWTTGSRQEHLCQKSCVMCINDKQKNKHRIRELVTQVRCCILNRTVCDSETGLSWQMTEGDRVHGLQRLKGDYYNKWQRLHRTSPLPLTVGRWRSPSITMFPGFPKVFIPDRTSIHSAVFTQRSNVTERRASLIACHAFDRAQKWQIERKYNTESRTAQRQTDAAQ